MSTHTKHEGRNTDKCPKCRCKGVEVNHHCADPQDEHASYFCSNCGFLVGVVDNSPYISCYEFEDFIIDT